MKKLISLSIKRPIGTLMFFIMLFILSLYFSFNIKTDFMPEIRVPCLSIVTTYAGLPCEEIKHTITIPLEDSLSSLKGIKKIDSVSKDSVSIINIEFDWNTDISIASVETREIIDSCYLSMHDGVSKPQVLLIDPLSIPTISIAIIPKDQDLSMAKNICTKEIKSIIQQQEGITEVKCLGGTDPIINVELDKEKSSLMNITPSSIANAIQTMNIEYPTGTINEGNIEYLVKADGKFKTIDDIKNVIIPINENIVTLKSIAKISKNVKQQNSAVFYNGKEAIILNIHKQAKFSPIIISKQINSLITNLKEQYPYFDFYIIDDYSKIINDSFSATIYSAVIGIVLAFFLLFLFLRNIKSSIIVSLSIPFSIITSVFCLYLFDKSLNVMSLGGLALGIGMLVDNAIVIIFQLNSVENVNDNTITNAVNDLSLSILSSTFTSIVVFIPIIFLPGLIGIIFRDMAYSVIFSLLMSLISSLFLIPVCFKLCCNNKKQIVNSSNKLEKKYRKLLRLFFRKPYLVITIIISTIILSIVFFLFTKKEYIEPTNEYKINIDTQFQSGTRIEEVKKHAIYINNILSKEKSIINIYQRIGGEADDPSYISSVSDSANIIHTTVILDSKNYNIQNNIKYISNIITQYYPDSFVFVPDNVLSIVLNLNNITNQYKVFCDDNWDKNPLLTNTIKKLNDYGSWDISSQNKNPQIKLLPNRYIIANNKLDIEKISTIISSAIFGAKASNIIIDNQTTDIEVKLSNTYKESLDNFSNITIPIINNDNSSFIRIDDLFYIETEFQSEKQFREDRKDVIHLKKTSQLKDDEILLLNKINAKKVNSNLLSQNLKEIILLLSLSIFLLYFLLGIQFESFTMPLILLSVIPMGIFGLLLMLFLTGNSININSVLGILVIIGVGVNNSIILYEVFKLELKAPKSLCLGAIYRGSSKRMRTIFASMLTTVLALIPQLFDFKQISSQTSLSAAITGGLFTISIISVVIIPIILWKKYEKKSY